MLVHPGASLGARPRRAVPIGVPLGDAGPTPAGGSFSLVLAPPVLLGEVEARLLLDVVARGQDVVLVCGDNRLDAFGLLARARSRGLEDALADGVRLTRAFTVHQFVALLEETLPRMAREQGTGLALVTGVLEPFLDEDVTPAEARALLPRTLDRLARTGADCGLPVVATNPPRTGRLADLARAHAPSCVEMGTWRVEGPQRRLDAFAEVA